MNRSLKLALTKAVSSSTGRVKKLDLWLYQTPQVRKNLRRREKAKLIHKYFVNLREYNKHKRLVLFLKCALILAAPSVLVAIPILYGEWLSLFEQLVVMLLCLCFILALYSYCTFPFLPVSDRQIDEWLKTDVQDMEREIEAHTNLAKQVHPPIKALNPINIRSVKDIDEISEEEWEKVTGVRGDEYFTESGLDGKERYSVYEIGIILTGESSLALYRCYFNFIRGVSLNNESPEYTYQEIASIKFSQEDEGSSREIGSRIKKTILREHLTISTTGSEQVTFTEYGPKYVYYEERNSYLLNNDNKPSLKKVGITVRDILREKHPKFTHVIVSGFEDEVI